MKKIIILLLFSTTLFAQKPTKTLSEEDFYELKTIPIPADVKLEVGGLATLPDGRLAVSTRRGEVWMIENPYMSNQTKPHYTLFASGMHEVLGLGYRAGSLYCTQRGELTKLTDDDGDGRADRYEAVTRWPLSGNYHEYSYGPVFDKNGDMFVTLNLAWVGYGEGKFAKWRGWLIKVSPDGKIEPIATGLRSPAGFSMNTSGDIFYGENQGDWVGSGRVTHLTKGTFAGNPGGLVWTAEADSPLKLQKADIPNTGEPMHIATQKVPALKLPAVWFPHTLMGISTADMVEDTTGGAFGPFGGQYFVADQGHSKVMRMYLEKVNGEYQGACFPFREGYQSGILRLRWGIDGSLFAGMTSRGWSATGKDLFGLQRLVWNGQMPFEIKTMKAMPDGFELEFTQPVSKATAENPASYELSSFTYKYHSTYGSPIVDNQPCKVVGTILSPDRKKVRLVLEGTRQYYVHQLKAEGLLNDDGQPLLHNFGFYTLNAIPKGEKAMLPTNTGMNHAGHDMATMKTETTKPVALKASAKRQTAMPADWTNGPDQTVTLGTIPGLKYDLSTIQVKAGSKIKWVFNNNDDMLHNCVIIAPNAADAIATQAMNLGLKGSEMAYVPNSPKVLFHTNLIEPETSESIYFVAPTQPGNYTFVCTFPGHAQVMRGVLKVVK